MAQWIQWLLLATVRLLFTLAPQTGYIHPDEFFQSVEIMAGDILDLEVHRSWEFNETQPVRSVVGAGLTVGPAFFLLRLLSSSSPYLLLVLPRVVFLVLSFFTDFMLYRISTWLGREPKNVLVTFSTSYIPYVYFTRTFSNTIEAFLFITLLYFVVKSFSQKQKSPGVKTTDSAHVIAGVIVLGIFNRPTFVVFAFVPYAVWLTNGSLKFNQKHRVQLVVNRLLVSSVTGFFIAFVFVICDSLYYHSIPNDFNQIIAIFSKKGFSGVISMLTVAPLNFIRYNTRASNLADHGIHPRLTHFVVNTPLLFNILAFFAFRDLLKQITTLKKLVHGPKVKLRALIRFVLLLSYGVPLAALSVFPHQEPRFLLPLVFIVALLYGEDIYGKKSKKTFTLLWIFTNLILGLFYGVLHQGGIIPAILRSQNGLKSGISRHYVYHHTYMPPRYLYAIPSQSCHTSDSFGILCDTTTIHDLKGASKQSLITYLEKLGSELETIRKVHDIYVLVPASLESDMKLKVQESKVLLKKQTSFCPHLSTEDLPTWKSIKPKGITFSVMGVIQNLKRLMCLNVYKVIKVM